MTTITANSCSQMDIQTAITEAVSGDTIIIPSGNCNFTSPISITKGLIIKGSGNTSTIITANNTCIFSINLNSEQNMRITDIGFNGSGGVCGGLEAQLIRLSGNGNTIWNSFRADHLKFTNIDAHAFTIDPWWNIPYHPKAVFDHIDFSSNKWSRLIKIAGNNSTWRELDQYGTDYAIFIETSKFVWENGAHGDITDTEHGTRMVIRYNNILNGDIQMHDTGSTPAARGQRITEVYNNTMTCTSNDCSSIPGIALRGGGYIVYNNIITGYWTPGFPYIERVLSGAGFLGSKCNGSLVSACNTPTFMHCKEGDHRSCSGSWDCSGGECVVACGSDSECPIGTDGTRTCLKSVDNVNEGNDPSGYPCRDQTGWGQEYGDGGRYQYSSPVYWYNNIDNNGNPALMHYGILNTPYFVENRDYCYHSPHTACGTKPGWNYTPYTYPHPLTNQNECPKIIASFNINII